MFANKPWKEIVIRIVSSAAILFNTTTVSVLAQGLEPTASPALESTKSPTATPPPTDTATSTITDETTTEPVTATSTLDVTSMPTPAVSATSSVESITGKPLLALSSDPAFMTPGGNLMLTWEVSEISSSAQSYVLALSLPEGVVPLLKTKEIVFDETSRILTVLVQEMKGKIHLQVDRSISDVLIKARLLENGTTIATAYLFLPVKEQFTLDAKGGPIEAEGGRIKLTLPKNILQGRTIFEVGKPAGDAIPKYSLSGKPFEIKAHREDTGEELRQFAEKLSITVSYADLGISESEESDLHLYWYDTDKEEWAALPTFMDKETKTITAFTDHFTVFDIGINNWQSSWLPTVDSFQVSEFTGAGTYSFPIQVPPGPGGFQPTVVLTYNSQIVDQSTLNTQASWVGMGWTLEAGSITLDTRNGYDDTHILSVGGITTRIVKDPNGVYHATDENFWKITFDGSTWTVWDKQGNRYFFERTAKYLNQLSRCPDPNTGYEWKTYRWFLTRVRNIFNQEIQYSYLDQINTVNVQQYYDGSKTCKHLSISAVTATYLFAITYANGRYRIGFGIGNYPNQSEPALPNRKDYVGSWDTDGVFHTYERYRLKNIYVEQDGNGDGAYETILRRYQLNYAADTDSDIIFPGHTWSAGGKTSTLRSVQEYGVGGAATLPPTTFTYADNLHLTRVENGYGGVVNFNYELWYYPADARDSYTAEVQFGRNEYPCYYDDPSPWYPLAGGSVNCGDGSRDPLNFRGLVTAGGISNPGSSIYGANHSTDFIRPGGKYKLTAAVSLQPGMSGRAGLLYGYGTLLEPFSANGTYFFTLPANASSLQPALEATGGSAFATVSDLKLRLLPSVYRVTTKQISDGNGHTYLYTYSYLNDSGVDSGGVNDAVLSPNGTCNREDTTCYEYFERFSEFRGHRQVTVTGPDGIQTITRFYQDDLLKGRPISTTTKIGSQVLTETLYEYQAQQLPMAVYSACAVCLPYRGLGRYWVYTSAVENRIYSSGGFFDAKKTLYAYESTYGNLLTETEYYKNGNDWIKYRVKEYTYYPKNSADGYLVSLPARVRTLNAADQVLSSTVFLYDNNTGNFAVSPVNGVLTAVRAQMQGTQWSQVSYGYDTWGNRISETTYSSYGAYDSPPATGARTTTTLYDSSFRVYPISQTTPPTPNASAGLTTTWEYDYDHNGVNDYILGVPTKETDPNGNVTKAAYDSFGRMISLTRPADTSPTLSMSYSDGYPFTTTITLNSMNYTVTRQYDGMGRQIRVVSGGVVADTIYESATVTKQSIPYEGASPGLFTVTAVNPAARTTTVTAPDGAVTTTITDGLTTTVRDANNHVTVSISDVWGRITSVQPPTGPSVSYLYDELNRLKTVTRGGVTTTLTYDYGGRKTSMSDPDMGAWTYAYDPLGNLTRQTDARGQRICLYYDALNRLIGKHYRADDNCPSNPTYNVTYTYDAGANGKGRRTGMTDASGSTAWTYDARGRMLTETKVISGASFTTAWTYNPADLPASMTYPDGETLTYTYNSRMLLESVTGTDTYVSSILYDSAGRITRLTRGAGTLDTTYTYYPWTQQGGRLQNLTTASLQNLTYTYDPVGNITQIADSLAGETHLYTYDALDRLTAWTLNGVTETYTYNPATGNLASKAGVTFQYNDAAHVHAVTSAGGNTYQYDANGNQTLRNVDGQTYMLGYDTENRLVSVSPGGTAMNAQPPLSFGPLPPKGKEQQRRGDMLSVSRDGGQGYFLIYNLHPLQQSAFPTTSVLDTFNRANGSIGNNWSGYTSAYAIASNQLDVSGSGSDTYIFWKNNNTPFGADQEAYVTLSQVDGNSPEQSLLLKSQSNDSYGNGVIEVLYDANNGLVQVWTYALSNGWVQHGADIPVTFANGDQFGARAKANGDVEIYKNGSLIGTRNVSSWQYYAGGGYIGLWFVNAADALLDDFGGGNVTSAPTSTPAASATPTHTATPQTPTATASPTQTLPSTPTATKTPTQTPSATITPSLTASPTLTMTPTQTFTPTATVSPTPTLTAPPPSLTEASFLYDGDGNRVAQTINGVTTYFVGAHYELTGSTVTKYYFAGASRIAMRKYTIPQSMSVEYLLGDHLGSTSLTTDANGTKVSEMRYKPWGEVRSWWTAGLSTTPAYTLPEYSFTGQYSHMDDPSTAAVTEGFGLMFYVSRMYDPALGRFAQADTIVPGGVQGWDRYAAMNNNPARYLDPSGHVSCSSVAEEDCSFETMSAVEVVKRTIKSKYGITMSEESDPNNLNPKTWSLENLRIIYNALGTIDAALNGKLKSLVGGATFKWGEHDPGGGTSTYHGLTYGTTITFYTIGNAGIRQMNIFHEFGHLIDNSPGTVNAFSRDPGINNPDFLNDDGYLDRMALIDKSQDMYQHPMSIYTDDPITAQEEHWADIFANYVAGNINLTTTEGQAMNAFVTGALAPYIGTP